MNLKDKLQAKLDECEVKSFFPNSYLEDKNAGWIEAMEWVLELLPKAEPDYSKICNYCECSDGDDKQYPECDMQEAIGCSVRRFKEMQEALEESQ